MSNLEIISVVNDFDCFDKTIKNNQFMNKYNLNVFDNRKENVGISERYNSFIEDKVLTGKVKDSWLVFCHQDFAFLEDPLEKLKDLDKGCIYGPIGAKKKFRTSNFIRTIIPTSLKKYIPNCLKKTVLTTYRTKSVGKMYQGFRSSKYFSLNQDYFKDHDSIEFMWGGMTLYKFTDELFFYHKKQTELKKPKEVDTLDCCCLIVHSSLIAKYGLRFDNELTFHLYTEDFSLNAKFNHKVKTKATQFVCFHRGEGSIDQIFVDDLEYLKNKYNGKRFVGACFNCDW